MNIQDVAEFLDLAKNPDKYTALLKSLVDEQERLNAVAETVVKVSAFDKEKKKFESEKNKIEKQLQASLEELEKTKQEDAAKVASLLQVNQTIKEENEVLNKQLKDKLAELDMKEVEYNKRISELSRKEINLEAAIQSTEDTRAQLEDKLAAIRSLGV